MTQTTDPTTIDPHTSFKTNFDRGVPKDKLMKHYCLNESEWERVMKSVNRIDAEEAERKNNRVR